MQNQLVQIANTSKNSQHQGKIVSLEKRLFEFSVEAFQKIGETAIAVQIIDERHEQVKNSSKNQIADVLQLRELSRVSRSIG